MMESVQLPHDCAGMTAAMRDPRVPISYLPKFREFGIEIDDGRVVQVIEFCPWCGHELPTSLRDAYFDELDRLGLEPESSGLPLDLRSDAWWRMRKPESNG